jgi:hypothetical protein
VGYVVVEQFSLKEGIAAAEFATRDEALQAWSYVHCPGLARRTTARGDDGEVLVLTLLQGHDAPIAPGSPQDGAPAAFAEAIEPGTYRRSVYRDLD